LRLRIAEKRREMIALDESVATVDAIMGVSLTKLSGPAAPCRQLRHGATA
jgi:hypothetical protein